MPPESWCGKARARRAGSGMPTWPSRVVTRCRTSRRPTGWWARIAAAICQPTGEHGLSEVIGSWKIRAMSRPTTARRWRGLRPSRSRPSNCNASAPTRPGSGISPISASIDTLLPEPDSPTMHRISPESMAMSTASTAWNRPRAVPNSTARLRMSSRGMPRGLSLPAVQGRTGGRAARRRSLADAIPPRRGCKSGRVAAVTPKYGRRSSRGRCGSPGCRPPRPRRGRRRRGRVGAPQPRAAARRGRRARRRARCRGP